MASRGFLDRTAAGLLKAAEGSFLRQQVIASNLANAETPGYKAMEVDFETALSQALEHARRDGSGAVERVMRVPVMVRMRSMGQQRWDKNNVNPEKELVDLAAAAAEHAAVVRLLSHKLRMLHLAISGRPE